MVGVMDGMGFLVWVAAVAGVSGKMDYLENPTIPASAVAARRCEAASGW
jgi:hypothetical protein